MSGKDFLYIGAGVAIGYFLLPVVLGMIGITGSGKR